MNNIKNYFRNNSKKYFVKKIYELDGISIECKDFWLNIRPSNTEPLLRLRIEGKNNKTINSVRKIVEKLINNN